MTLQVRELAAWPLDPFAHRPEGLSRCASAHIFQPQSALLRKETASHRHLFATMSARPDLQREMAGLDWSFGVIDLRLLLAFQRRLTLDPRIPRTPPEPEAASLFRLAFAHPRPAIYESFTEGNTLILRSADPNLQVSLQPLRIHTGSPFFEVAHYRSRWFLRDGYHRAYAMLSAGIHACPALIVQARNLAELGATQPHFFPEAVLFSTYPPRVIDFLDDTLTITYPRSPLCKTIRVTIEEGAPA